MLIWVTISVASVEHLSNTTNNATTLTPMWTIPNVASLYNT